MDTCEAELSLPRAVILSFINDPQWTTFTELKLVIPTIQALLTIDSRKTAILSLFPLQLWGSSLNSLSFLLESFSSDENCSEVDEINGVIGDVTRVLEELLLPYNYRYLHEHYRASKTIEQVFLLQGLQSELSDVKILCLKELSKSLKSEDTATLLLSASEIVDVLCESIADEHTMTSNRASQLIISLARISPRNFDSSSSSFKIFTRFLDSEVTGAEKPEHQMIRLRVFELFAELLQIFSDSTMEAILFGNHLSGHSDILFSSNIIQIYGNFFKNSKKYKLLEQFDILSDISKYLDTESLLCSISFKFFSSLCRQLDSAVDTVLIKYHIPENLGKLLDEKDVSHKMLSLECLSDICSNAYAVLALSHTLPLSKVASTFLHSVSELRIAALHVLASIFNASPLESEISSFSHQLVTVHQLPFTIFFDTLRLPFFEARNGAFFALQGLFRFSWARRMIASQSNLMDYLLNRATETTKEGKEWKFSLIQLLTSSKESENELGSYYYSKCIKFTNDGPFFVEAQPQLEYQAT